MVRSAMASRALVVGATDAALTFAMMLANSGRRVTVAHSDAALISHLVGNREITVGKSLLQVPAHVSFAEVNQVESAEACLADSSVVFAFGEQDDVRKLLVPIAAAISRAPSLAPEGLLKSFPKGGLEIEELDGAVASGKKMGNCFPVVMVTEGGSVLEANSTTTKEFSKQFPELKSIFAMLSPSFQGQWVSSVQAMPRLSPSRPEDIEVNNNCVNVFSNNGQLLSLPRLIIGPSENASMRSRDALVAMLKSFEITWVPSGENDGLFSAGDGMIHLAQSLKMAASFGAGVASSAYGQHPHAIWTVHSHVSAAANDVCGALKSPLSASLQTEIAAAVVDTNVEEYVFGRRLGAMLIPQNAASKAFKSDFRLGSLNNSLGALAALETRKSPRFGHGFFGGLCRLSRGELRANFIARSLATSTIDWEEQSPDFARMKQAIEVLDQGVMTSPSAAQAAFARADEMLKR